MPSFNLWGPTSSPNPARLYWNLVQFINLIINKQCWQADKVCSETTHVQMFTEYYWSLINRFHSIGWESVALAISLWSMQTDQNYPMLCYYIDSFLNVKTILCAWINTIWSCSIIYLIYISFGFSLLIVCYNFCICLHKWFYSFG